MSETTKGYQIAVQLPHDNIELLLICHLTPEDMRDAVKERFGDVPHMSALFSDSDRLETMHGLTVGETDENGGGTVINIFIPLNCAEEDYSEIISHESVHVAMAILRYRISGDMNQTIPVKISVESGVEDLVHEETIAGLVGMISRILEQGISKIKAASVSE